MLNLTPHAIVILNDAQEEIVSFEPSGTIARVSTSEKEVGVWNYDGDYIAIVVGQKGEVIGLPEDKDAQFLVSGMVLESLGSEYHNIAFAPDTGATAVRNDKGHIIGVTRLRTVPKRKESHKLYLTEAMTFVEEFDCFEALQNYVAEFVEPGTLCSYTTNNAKGEPIAGNQWLAK